ncbi:unnamed protein product [Vitrella brassicaformis CCMP3155]|uniref:Uncharacterized protein n=1 Tax=Vitrella brassicaformis (strain CCMP3155) TaxID=1169540 RepID=A0A0G4EQ54_VITBC|nr:unnamed protein product [Vitrella brassicaformis CCMP3155]|eukprot:CEL99416.1 unnamed protein product [Vitrella brassicaformis CCMP3155]
MARGHFSLPLWPLLLLALSPVAHVSGGCLNRDDLPVLEMSDLKKLSIKQLDEIFTKGCIEEEPLLGPHWGGILNSILHEPAEDIYRGLFGLVFEGALFQKTSCKGEDLWFYFPLLNPFDGGKLFKSQVTLFTARVTTGQFPHEKHRISKEDCPDLASPWGRLKYPLDNPPILKDIIDEARIVGVDEKGRAIILNRAFLKIWEDVVIFLQYEAPDEGSARRPLSVPR